MTDFVVTPMGPFRDAFPPDEDELRADLAAADAEIDKLRGELWDAKQRAYNAENVLSQQAHVIKKLRFRIESALEYVSGELSREKKFAEHPTVDKTRFVIIHEFNLKLHDLLTIPPLDTILENSI